MRLLFMVNFYTSDRWGECRHTHQVLVCEDFSQVCELVKKLRLTAETVNYKVPKSTKSIFQDSGCAR